MIEEPRVAIESFRPWWDAILRRGRARFRSHEPDLHSDDILRFERGGTNSRHTKTIGGAFDVRAFCRYTGITELEYQRIGKAMRDPLARPSLDMDLVDRVLVAWGLTHVMPTLYWAFPKRDAQRHRKRPDAVESLDAYLERTRASKARRRALKAS